MPALREIRSDILSRHRRPLYDVLQFNRARHACGGIGDYWSDRSNDGVRKRTRLPGRIGCQQSRHRILPRRGSPRLRPRLSLGWPTPQSLWSMGAGTLCAQHPCLSEAFCPTGDPAAFRFNLPANTQFLAQVPDHLVACAGLPAAAPADRGVFDFRGNLYGDKHPTGVTEDVGQGGGEFLYFREGESPRIAGAARDLVVVDVFGI